MTVRRFDLAAWLRDNTDSGPLLQPETMAAIANFTVMWNMFEGLVCRSEASVRTLELVVGRLASDRISADDQALLEECLRFWQFRYTSTEGMTDRFVRLNFRRGDRQDLVAKVLTGKSTEFRDVALALLIIVYRLRNNLFHGLKSFESLNYQVPNLDMAARCLGVMLQASSSNLVWHQRASQA